jgi:hypothetical protein
VKEAHQSINIVFDIHNVIALSPIQDQTSKSQFLSLAAVLPETLLSAAGVPLGKHGKHVQFRVTHAQLQQKKRNHP